ncbi:hypothetical protein [Cellulosimicrobium sp. TH-20]|uniref:hypothetical protein n=1 Tax=Cellulosimicrobium sp. TH-20 TaxID=1980001 RepID=UPI001642E214|nr:hypothetical protein [Cellulosimicrobium sp. TH-20]
MALTRRTARFGELARAADAELACRGVDVDAAAVDEALNARVARSAQLLGVEPRAALAYAPDDVAAWIADELAGAAPAAEAAPGGRHRPRRTAKQSLQVAARIALVRTHRSGR